MTIPSFPFRNSDEVEFREPVIRCAKCRVAWPCPDAKAVYASPPATVDVGALLELRELVEKWRTRIPANAGDSARVIMREACADELAALIGEKA